MDKLLSTLQASEGSREMSATSSGRSNVRGTKRRLRWGKIGTDGQALEKSFATLALAEKEGARLVAEKTRRATEPSTRARRLRRKSSTSRALMTPIGRVVADSNFVALVVVDGARASDYRHPFDEEEEGHLDFDKTMDGPLPIGKSKGLILALGSSGPADVYRFGDAFVPCGHRGGRRRRRCRDGQAPRARRASDDEGEAHVLVLMGQHDRGPKLELAKVKKAGVVKTKSGTAIAVAPGRARRSTSTRSTCRKSTGSR